MFKKSEKWERLGKQGNIWKKKGKDLLGSRLVAELLASLHDPSLFPRAKKDTAALSSSQHQSGISAAGELTASAQS